MPSLISFLRCIILVLIGGSETWPLTAAEFTAAVADNGGFSQPQARIKPQLCSGSRVVISGIVPHLSYQHEQMWCFDIDQCTMHQTFEAKRPQQHPASDTYEASCHAMQLPYRQPRYDNQAVSRFYSNDPVGFTVSNPMSFNRFAYANNNPYKFVDPDGRVGVLACIPAAAVCGTAIQATVNAVGAIAIAAVGSLTEAAEGAPADADSVVDRSDQPGTSDEVQGFKDDLNGISTPQSDNPKVRTLTPGIKVKDLIDKAPGVTSENGRKQTENGNIGTHGSNSTQDENGKNVATLSVRERNNVWKYRESNNK